MLFTALPYFSIHSMANGLNSHLQNKHLTMNESENIGILRKAKR